MNGLTVPSPVFIPWKFRMQVSQPQVVETPNPIPEVVMTTMSGY